MVYEVMILSIILIGIYIYIIFKNKATADNIFLTISFLILFIVSGFRKNVGVDFRNYEAIFRQHTNNNFFDYSYVDKDYGYALLNKIIALFTNNTQWVFIVVSFITIILFIIFIKRYSTNMLLSVYLLITFNFYFDAMNIQRQFIAIAICTLSIKYIINEDFKRFCLVILFAILIHKSALIFFPMYFISKINLNVKKICIYIVLGCAGSLLINKIIYFMRNKFYSDYDSVAWGMQGLGIGLIIIIPVFIFIIAFMMKDKLIEENPENNVFLNLLFCACVCFLLSTIISNFTRIAEYFYIVVIIFIPRMISVIKDYRIRYNIYLLVMFISFVWFYKTTLQGNMNGVLPYTIGF